MIIRPPTGRTNVSVFVFAISSGGIVVVRRGWVGYAEKLAGQCDVAGPIGIGEEAVVSNAVETVGQHVDQKAADELVDVERHQLIAGVGLGPVILPFERHARAVEGDEPAVGNSDPVSVAGQVGERTSTARDE